MNTITVNDAAINEILRGLIALEAQFSMNAYDLGNAMKYDGQTGDVAYFRARAEDAKRVYNEVASQVPHSLHPTR